MIEHKFTLKVPLDGEGYLALACPHCRGCFKVRGGEFENWEGAQLYCALCGLHAPPGRRRTL